MLPQYEIFLGNGDIDALTNSTAYNTAHASTKIIRHAIPLSNTIQYNIHPSPHASAVFAFPRRQYRSCYPGTTRKVVCQGSIESLVANRMVRDARYYKAITCNHHKVMNELDGLGFDIFNNSLPCHAIQHHLATALIGRMEVHTLNVSRNAGDAYLCIRFWMTLSWK